MAEGDGGTQVLELTPTSAEQISKRKPDSSLLDGADDPRRTSKIPRTDQDQNPSTNPSDDPSAENGKKEKLVDEAKITVQEEVAEADQKLIVQEVVAVPDQNLDSISGNFVDKGKGKAIVQEEGTELDQNPNPSSRSFVDKGKGKMIVQEEEIELDENIIPSSRPFVDKGKGKMIVQEEDGSSDDGDEICGTSGSDDDYSDDPLMELDLNNIISSRTRCFSPQVPGAYLIPSDEEDDDEDDDDVSVDDDDVDDDDDDDSE